MPLKFSKAPPQTNQFIVKFCNFWEVFASSLLTVMSNFHFFERMYDMCVGTYIKFINFKDFKTKKELLLIVRISLWVDSH